MSYDDDAAVAWIKLFAQRHILVQNGPKLGSIADRFNHPVDVAKAMHCAQSAADRLHRGASRLRNEAAAETNRASAAISAAIDFAINTSGRREEG